MAASSGIECSHGSAPSGNADLIALAHRMVIELVSKGGVFFDIVNVVIIHNHG